METMRAKHKKVRRTHLSFNDLMDDFLADLMNRHQDEEPNQEEILRYGDQYFGDTPHSDTFKDWVEKNYNKIAKTLSEYSASWITYYQDLQNLKPDEEVGHLVLGQLRVGFMQNSSGSFYPKAHQLNASPENRYMTDHSEETLKDLIQALPDFIRKAENYFDI